jgi:hypothetical protein
MVQYLQVGQLDKVSELLPTTIEGALDATPMHMIAKVIDPVKVESFIAYQLTRLATLVNVDQRLNIQPHQVRFIAQALMENFSYESLADINLCLKRGAMGFYGEIYRIDAAVITGWMQNYLDEKYDALEQRQKKAKKQDKSERKSDAVDGSKYIAEMLENLGVQQKEHGPREETEYQRHKLENPHPVTPPEEVEKKLARIRELQIKALRDKHPGASDEEINHLLTKL